MSACCQRVVIQGPCMWHVRICISCLQLSYKQSSRKGVERLQWSIAHFVTDDHRLTSSVTKMFSQSTMANYGTYKGIPTADCVLTNSALIGKYSATPSYQTFSYFHRCHQLYVFIQGHTDIYGYSFFHHLVRLWNTLTTRIALNPSLMIFQTGLQNVVFTSSDYLKRL